jgi:hypothetical protein
VSRALGALGRLGSAGQSQSPGVVRLRRVVAVLFLVYGVLLASQRLREGNAPTVGEVMLLMCAVAVYIGRGGRFVRDLLPIAMGLISYGLLTSYAQRFSFGVHYVPQIRADRVIGIGEVPTVWLQSHLYSGSTGPLEVFAVLMWLSHFVVPLVFGFGLWLRGRYEAFATLMCGLLAALVLGEITFVFAPTAPPWLAAQHGYLPPVHHLLKQSLAAMHLGGIAKIDGDPHHYNVVAAIPSLHAAFPVIGLLVARRFGLRWAQRIFALQVLGVTFAIVYTGEHYVVDALAGALYAIVITRAIALLVDQRRAKPRQTERRARSRASAAGGGAEPS